MWQDFIQQANQFGKSKRPFFFLIDFEQQKPMLCPLNETATQDIYVQFPAYRNLDWQERLPTEAFYLRKHISVIPICLISPIQRLLKPIILCANCSKQAKPSINCCLKINLCVSRRNVL